MIAFISLLLLCTASYQGCNGRRYIYIYIYMFVYL